MRKLAVIGSLLVTVTFAALAQQHPRAQPTAAPSESQPVQTQRDLKTPPATLLPAAAKSAMRIVNPERIRAHVKFLASDLLEGRGTGQRGGNLAAEYMAAQLALDGLVPAGDNGSYMQSVALVGIETTPQTSLALVSDTGATMALQLGRDIVAMDESQQPTSVIDAPIIFVGYGIAAPEFNWDDYKGVDVGGKVLLMLVNEPPSDDPKFFNGKALTYYGRWSYKFEEAARRGAIGAVLVHKTEMASYGWNVVQASWSGERSYLRAEPGPRLKLAAWLTYEIANELAASTGRDMQALIAAAESRDFRPVPLPFRLRGHMVSKIRPFDSPNVLAVLPGSDPVLKKQAVLYTAHFDHLGIRPDQPGDNIYNGAVDNATGCGILLEIARALAATPQRPRRSVLFAAVTAEEQGLRGSEYLGRHLPFSAGKINLALNFDALLPIGIPEAVEVSGAERTTFYPVVKKTASTLHLSIEPDANPGAGFYYRSDHFSLARVGIPAFSISQGLKFQGHPREWGEQYEREFTARNYHQPSDKYHAEWDFRGNAKLAAFGIALGWQAANTPQTLGWVAGDEFAAPRRASQAAIPLPPAEHGR